MYMKFELAINKQRK